MGAGERGGGRREGSRNRGVERGAEYMGLYGGSRTRGTAGSKRGLWGAREGRGHLVVEMGGEAFEGLRKQHAVACVIQ